MTPVVLQRQELATSAPSVAPPPRSQRPPRTRIIPRTTRTLSPERLLIQEPPIVLEHEDLMDTEHYIGCLAFFDGQIGLSFKGLQLEIDLQVTGRRDLYECQPGTFQPLVMSPTTAQAVRSVLDIWDAWQALIALESDPTTPDGPIASARVELNRSYNEFTDAYGTLHQCKHLLQFDGVADVRLGLLLALELVDEDGTVYKADCFSERTYFPLQEAFGQIYFDEEVNERLVKAYARVLNECNEVEIDRIAEYTGTDMVEAEQALVDLGLIMREPILPRGSGHRGSLSGADIVDLP